MTFDPELINQLMLSAGPQSAAAIASISGFFFDVYNYFAEKKSKQEKADLDDYLEWLRRKDQGQLVNLILNNREHFETLFEQMESSVVDAINDLNKTVKNMHRDLTDLVVNPDKFKITIQEWNPESNFTLDGSRQTTKIRAKLTIVNLNLTELTLTEIMGTVTHNSDRINVKLIPARAPDKYVINRSGGSVTVILSSVTKLAWAPEDTMHQEQLSLKFDQTDKWIPINFD